MDTRDPEPEAMLSTVSSIPSEIGVKKCYTIRMGAYRKTIDNFFMKRPHTAGWLMFGLTAIAVVGARLVVIGYVLTGMIVTVVAGSVVLSMIGTFFSKKMDAAMDLFRYNPWSHALLLSLGIFTVFFYESMEGVRQFVVEWLWFFVPFLIIYLIIFTGMWHERRTGINSYTRLMDRLPAHSMRHKIMLMITVVSAFVFIFGLLGLIVIDSVGMIIGLYECAVWVIR